MEEGIVSAQVNQRMNRTGMNLKPDESRLMIEGVGEFPPPRQDGDGTLILATRTGYIREGEPIGSMPTMLASRGEVESTKGDMAGQPLVVLADKLGERLAFERTGTRLYQAFLGKMTSADGQAAAIQVREVERILNDEYQHFLLLRQAIEELGGDPTAVTPGADVAGVMAMGILQVITDPRTTLDQCLCALLTAELVDNDGWELLATLAEGLGHEEIGRQCRTAQDDEIRHLELVRGWIHAGTLQKAGISGTSKRTRGKSSMRRTTVTTRTSASRRKSA
jgi:hypothetical protein